MYGNGCAGSTASGVSTGKTWSRKNAWSRSCSVVRQRVPVDEGDPGVGQGRRDDLAVDGGVLCSAARARVSLIAVEHLARLEAAGRGDREAGRDAALEAGDPDHEELVEVAREDREEPGPLEQRQPLVLGEREDPLVEGEPADSSRSRNRSGKSAGEGADEAAGASATGGSSTATVARAVGSAAGAAAAAATAELRVGRRVRGAVGADSAATSGPPTGVGPGLLAAGEVMPSIVSCGVPATEGLEAVKTRAGHPFGQTAASGRRENMTSVSQWVNPRLRYTARAGSLSAST